MKKELNKEKEKITFEIRKRVLNDIEKLMKEQDIKPIKGIDKYRIRRPKPKPTNIKEAIQYRNKHWRT